MTEVEVAHLNAIDTTGRDLRHGWQPLQEGVVAPADLKVTTSGAGLGLDVPAGVGFVQGDALTDQGLYRCRNDAPKGSGAFSGGGIAAAHGTLPRIDQIIARVYDHDEDGSGSRVWLLEKVTGTATSGATLDNRTGATTLPAGAMRLADVLVPAAFAGPFVDATHLRDRRPWARGAYSCQRQLSGADYSITGTSFAALDATNVQRRLELSGKPLRVRLDLSGMAFAAIGNIATLQARLDGATAEGTEGKVYHQEVANAQQPQTFVWEIPAPAAGSRLVNVYIKVSAGTLTIQRGADYGVAFTLEEILRESGSND